MRILSKKKLESLTIEVTENGFIVWNKKRWIVDASMFRTSGEISLSVLNTDKVFVPITPMIPTVVSFKLKEVTVRKKK